MVDVKTVDDAGGTPKDPLSAVKRESVDRIKAALLSSCMDDPQSATAAIQQVTILRAYHQIIRIVQYIDLMDELEDKLYQSIRLDLKSADVFDPTTIARLVAIQERMQKMMVESNKLLAPYLDMTSYPAFSELPELNADSQEKLGLTSSQRDGIRESAGAILADIKKLAPVPVE